MKNKSLTTLLIEQEKVAESLRNILRNTLHRDFDGDIIFKSCLMANIRLGLGDKEFERCEELYS